MLEFIIVATVVSILVLGGAIIMAMNKQEKKEMRDDVRENIKLHNETKIKLAEAKFAYEKALLELNLLEAQDEKLKADIDEKMGKLGFLGRLPMIMGR